MRKMIVLFFAIVTCWGVASCAPEGDPETAIVFANMAVGEKTQCVAPASGGSSVETRPVGVLDLLLANRYKMFPIVFNGLSSVETTLGVGVKTLALEGHILTFKGAWISYSIDGLLGQYEDGAATKLPKQFIPTTGAVEPEKFGIVEIEVVPPPIVQLLDKDMAFDQLGTGGYMIATVVLEGQLSDGTMVHTPEFHYPITVCRGCLTSYEVIEERCCLFEDAPAMFPCFPGQDSRYSCLLGCWLTYRDRPDRYAEKMAMLNGYIKSLNVDLTEVPMPDWFLERIAPVPGTYNYVSPGDEEEEPEEETVE
jgi:hypothetical protein